MSIHKRRHISRAKYSILFRSFIADIPASKAALIINVNRKTADRYYGIFRGVILEAAKKERELIKLADGIEIDESYFGPKRIRGKRGRGASKKIIVLGLLKRNTRIYTTVISNSEKREIMPIIRRVIQTGSDIYTDGWKSYNALAVLGYNHKRVKHKDNEFVCARDRQTHINGVESYWSWIKRRLIKFNGIPRKKFKDHLLESEWRFNHRHNLTKELIKLLRSY